MDEIREFLVGEEEEGDRLDVYLSEQLGDMSRSYIQKIIKDKKVEVNNKIEKAKYLVKEEDKVKIEIPAPKLLEVIAQDIPIDIVYEDNDVLIVNKIDVMEHFDFNMDLLEERVRKLNKDIIIIPISAKTGEGVELWVKWLREQIKGEN